MDEILATARDLELEVNEDDIEELVMGHDDGLSIEELQEILNEELQETQRNVSPSEQEEDERGPMPTSAIKDLFKKWEDVRAMVLEWHPNQADVSRKLAKQINNLRPSNEETNTIISGKGHVSVDAREASEALAQHYPNESRLAFSSSDKHFARVTRNQIKSFRNRPADNPLFNVDFTLPELSYALQILDTNKSPGPDSIPGHFLSHLEILGRERLLYLCNLSWKTTKTVEIGPHYSHS
ncbi:uncharacterized protein TNCV_4530231 [Trichonephila clavipes]|nr:uncharacterized protein TNCV_4530231 [Trichonephila clavipes]